MESTVSITADIGPGR